MPTDDKTLERPARLIGALGACGAGAAVLLGAAWLLRAPVAQALLQSRLAEAGVDGAVTVERLDLQGAVLSGVRLGPVSAPDFAADRVTIAVSWAWFGPKVAAVRVENGALRARIDGDGLSLGAIDALMPPPGRAPPALPRMALDASGLDITLETPFGRFVGDAQARGRLDQDFKLGVEFPRQSVSNGETGSVQGAALSLEAQGAGGRIAARFAGEAQSVRSGAFTLNALSLAGEATAASSLTNLGGKIRASAAAASFGDASIGAPAFEATGSATDLAPGWRPQGGRLDADLRAASLTSPAAQARSLKAAVSLTGGGEGAQGPWRVAAERLDAGGVRFAQPTLSGAAEIAGGGNGAVTLRGALSAPEGSASSRLITQAQAAVPLLAGTPLEGPTGAARRALGRGFERFSLQAPIIATWRGGAGAAWVSGPISARGASGLTLEIEALRAGGEGALGRVTWPEGALSAAAKARLSGDGFPETELTLESAPEPGRALRAKGRFSMAPWRDGRASAELQNLAYDLAADDAGGRLTLNGVTRLTGPLGGMSVRALEAPIDLHIDWNAAGLTIAPADRPCLAVGAAELGAVGLAFPRVAVQVCPEGGAFYRVRDGRLSGGFVTERLAMSGRATVSGAPTAVSMTRLAALLEGPSTAPRLGFAAQGLGFSQQLAERALAVTGERVEGDVSFRGGGWRAEGRLLGVVVDDPALPATVAAVQADWNAAPAGAGVAFQFSAGTASVADKTAPARFQPLAVRDVSGALLDGQIAAQGRFALAAGEDRTLGAFTARHALDAGVGDAAVTTRDLRFSPSLELVEVTELARGVVETVRGPVDADISVRWTPSGVAARGQLTLKSISAATAGLGPVEGINGSVAFDDVFALTTPPGQTLRIARINPGVPVSDGAVRFQLKPNMVVGLEDARFPFAGGVLSVAPTEIVIGAEETQYRLRLDGVDVERFLKDMNLKDLGATGRLSGELPLVITPLGGRIEGGRLEAAPGGGTISYTGQAAAAAQAGGQLAFDALKGFRYENLILEVSGDLEGDLITTVRFEGVNIAPVRPLPMLPTISRSGLPFRFNVRVEAPFGALIDQATRTLDPLALIQESVSVETGPGAPAEGSAPIQPPAPIPSPRN